jgi:hypothetical protein
VEFLKAGMETSQCPSCNQSATVLNLIVGLTKTYNEVFHRLWYLFELQMKQIGGKTSRSVDKDLGVGER